MKILHVIYSNAIAGAEKYLRHLLPLLQEGDIECHLIVVSDPAFESRFHAYRHEMCGKKIPTQILVYSKKNFLAAAKKIATYASENNIEYLHSHLINSDILALMVKYLYNKKIKLFSTKHGYNENVLQKVTDINHLGRLKLKAKFSPYYYVTWVTLKMIKTNFAVSKAMSVFYHKMGFTKTEMPYIHHGVDIPQVNDAAGSRLANPQLVIIGRLEIVKGHDYLLKAMPDIIARYPACKLLILGSGSNKAALEQRINEMKLHDNVTLMGFQPNPYSYIQQSDVVIIPSLFEPFGLVFIEALALKKAIVAFDTPAGNEILTNNETGLLVDRADHKKLAAAILELLHNKELNNELAENGHKAYLHNFTTEIMVANTKRFYQENN